MLLNGLRPQLNRPWDFSPVRQLPMTYYLENVF